MIDSELQDVLDEISLHVAELGLSEDMNRLEQGQRLSDAKALCEAYRQSFSRYCWRQRFPVKRALALIAVWRAYERDELPIAKIHDLGWPKLMTLAKADALKDHVRH